MKIIVAGALSALGGIACGINALRIKFGFANKDNDKFMAESKARLSDPTYVEKMRKYGYKI